MKAVDNSSNMLPLDPAKGAVASNSSNAATSANAAAQTAATEKAASTAAPAVSLQVNEAAKPVAAEQASDVKLLDQIRAKIKDGSFKIDYEKLSQSILRDTMASIGPRKQQTQA